MTNTNCKLCLFSDDIHSDAECKFEIIDRIRDIKKIDHIDNYNYIHDYRCSYGFSKETYINNEALHEIDIVEVVRNKSTIIYYLMTDFRGLNDEQILKTINEINLLEISPTFVSIILDTNEDTNARLKIIGHNIKFKWKIHSFLKTISFNQCCNTALETTAQITGAKYVMFYDPMVVSEISLNSKIKIAHLYIKVLQKLVHCFQESKSTISGIFMPISIYKSVLNAGEGDLLYVLSEVKDMIINDYKIE